MLQAFLGLSAEVQLAIVGVISAAVVGILAIWRERMSSHPPIIPPPNLPHDDPVAAALEALNMTLLDFKALHVRLGAQLDTNGESLEEVAQQLKRRQERDAELIRIGERLAEELRDVREELRVGHELRRRQSSG